MTLVSPEIRKEMEELTLRLAQEHLPRGTVPTIRWTNAKGYLGEAFYSFLCLRNPKISYSRILRFYSPEERIETVYHEVSHLIVFYSIAEKFPLHEVWRELEKEGSHGPLFHLRMKDFGYPNPTGC